MFKYFTKAHLIGRFDKILYLFSFLSFICYVDVLTCPSFAVYMATHENKFKREKAANNSLNFVYYRNRLLIFALLGRKKHSE
jgi:hypothetical protein